MFNLLSLLIPNINHEERETIRKASFAFFSCFIGDLAVKHPMLKSVAKADTFHPEGN
jgi:hypothetical protein